MKTRQCYNCKCTDHIRKEYPRDIMCHACFQVSVPYSSMGEYANDIIEGHTQLECPVQLYGEYVNDIIEGQHADTASTSS